MKHYKFDNFSFNPKPRFSLQNSVDKLKKMGWKKIMIWSALIISGLIAAAVATFIILIAVVSIGLPDVKDLDKLSIAQSTTIYDREGNVLYVKHGGENRQYVEFSQISTNIIDATVAIEDDQFWIHPGFDTIGIIRAVVNNALHLSSTQGGSTITQQYIKNTFLSSEKSYIRKLKELILAIRLEQTYDKKKILELYLNKIPYGNNSYGVEKAAEVYFGKHAKDLDIAESSVLASLPKSQSYYNPYGPHQYSSLTRQFSPEEITQRNITAEKDLNDNEFLRGLIGKNIKIDETRTIYIQGRTDLVLKAMEKMGKISEEQKKESLLKLQNIKFTAYHEQIKHPHFVFYVLSQLEEKYGKEVIEQGGLNVYTTLDPNMQDSAEKIIAEEAAKNDEKYNVKNAGLIAIDPITGEILTMVGSRNYWDPKIDGQVNVADSFRQPGSSFKPFVYAQAFYNRYAPASIIFDTETRMGLSAFPKNFDGKFRGPISIREALGQSRNIPAIKAYFLAGEQKPIIDLAQKMGINFLDTTRDYGYTLSIGTAEVKLIDMVSAFGVFANNGVRQKPITILKVTNAKGDILEEAATQPGEEVLDPQIAYLITSILSDTGVRLGPNMTVDGHTNAAKTGTSNRKTPAGKYLPHDLWAVGYTPHLAAGVWTGNNRDDEGELSIYADGYTTSAPIFKKFMIAALKDKPNEEFPIPEGIKQVMISKANGMLPGPNTPADQQKLELFASFSVPTEIDDSYLEAEVDTRNNKLANEYCPEDFIAKKTFLNLHDIAPYPEWEKGAQAWIQSHMGETAGPNTILGPPPITSSELCTPENLGKKPAIEITWPAAGETVQSGINFIVKVKITAPNKLDKVEYYYDDLYKYNSSTSPYDGVIRLPKGEIGTNRHTVTAKAIDIYGYSSEYTVEIKTSPDGSSASSTTTPSTAADSGPETSTPASSPTPQPSASTPSSNSQTTTTIPVPPTPLPDPNQPTI
jgi:membrane peptidoglycan carboxypeptidase